MNARKIRQQSGPVYLVVMKETVVAQDIAGAIAMIYILPGIMILVITSRLLSGKSAAARGFAQL